MDVQSEYAWIKTSKVTLAMVLVNCVVYFILEWMGNTEDAEFMYHCGAMFPPAIQENGEYWRLFTSNFMHFGFMHLFNNMIMLVAAGRILEEALGMWKYLVLYVGAGISGSVLSYLYMIKTGDYAVSAGASGAIFGIVGGLLWVVLYHKGKYQSLTRQGMFVMIALCMYYGISTANVDNWGHLGGLLSGFVLAMIFYRGTQRY